MLRSLAEAIASVEVAATRVCEKQPSEFNGGFSAKGQERERVDGDGRKRQS